MRYLVNTYAYGVGNGDQMINAGYTNWLCFPIGKKIELCD